MEHGGGGALLIKGRKADGMRLGGCMWVEQAVEGKWG